MQEDKIIQAIKLAQFGMMEAVFKTPPSTYDKLQYNIGFYQGLNAALQAIADSHKDTDND